MIRARHRHRVTACQCRHHVTRLIQLSKNPRKVDLRENSQTISGISSPEKFYTYWMRCSGTRSYFVLINQVKTCFYKSNLPVPTLILRVSSRGGQCLPNLVNVALYQINRPLSNTALQNHFFTLLYRRH
jgi:hypothetical protein